MTLSEKLSKIQEEFKSKKSRFNSFGKYNFRSAEDILEALKPFNAKYGIYFTISEQLQYDSVLPIIKSTATISDGETKIKASSIVGVDLNQKGMQTPQQFGSASSYAKKYSLGNLLLIDDTQDSDATNVPEKKDEKAWLNKTDPAYAKAVKYLADGGNIKVIMDKYKLSTEVKNELLKVN
jgi:hypothetical protein